VLREVRTLEVPELGARHQRVQLRTAALRVGIERSVRVASVFGVLDRGARFSHLMSRPCVTVLLEGRGRLDEGGRRCSVEAGSLVLSDQRAGGTEAYAGEVVRWLVLDWDPEVMGARFAGPASITRLPPRLVQRLARAAERLAGLDGATASADIVDLLRAQGLAFERARGADLAAQSTAAERRLVHVVNERLALLAQHPAIDEVAGDLGVSVRHVHRSMAAAAQRHAMPWTSWRAELHRSRILAALRLLSVPRASTEGVARFTGFRSASALCHAFDDAGLPSPGTFVRDARRDVIEGWADHALRPAA
jgi:AraC-like DNA-binding protein